MQAVKPGTSLVSVEAIEAFQRLEEKKEAASRQLLVYAYIWIIPERSKTPKSQGDSTINIRYCKPGMIVFNPVGFNLNVEDQVEET